MMAARPGDRVSFHVLSEGSFVNQFCRFRRSPASAGPDRTVRHRTRIQPDMTRRILAAASLCMIIPAGGAGAAVLTFTDVAASNGDSIPQDYGDIPAVLDIIYTSAASDPDIRDLSFWDTGYAGLTDVAFGNRFQPDIAEIFFDPAPGFSVTLNSFDLGSWLGANRTTEWSILSGDGVTLAESGAIPIGNSPLSVVLGGLTSGSGIRLQWGPENYYVGIDNIDFGINGSIAAIPLPAAAGFLFTGLAMLAGMWGAKGRSRDRKSFDTGAATRTIGKL
jgi:hypothetical protein